jgi:hypothetical protein
MMDEGEMKGQESGKQKAESRKQKAERQEQRFPSPCKPSFYSSGLNLPWFSKSKIKD